MCGKLTDIKDGCDSLLCGDTMLSLILVALITFAFGAAVGAMCVLVRNRRKSIEEGAWEEKSSSEPVEDEALKAGSSPSPESQKQEEKSPAHDTEEVPASKKDTDGGATPLRAYAESLCSNNLRELVIDRLDSQRVMIEAWATEAVDTLDELSRACSSAGEDAAALEHLCDELREMLTAAGCTIVDEDEWNPSLQRAVKTEKTLPVGAPPRIGKKLVSGLVVQGQLVRKQEVVLQTQTEQ